MAHRDQLQKTSIKAHPILVQTLLDTLTMSSDRNGFAAAWARIAEHFDTIFTIEWSIDQLIQTILQLAGTGKLVPQDPNDEPASEILKIAALSCRRITSSGSGHEAGRSPQHCLQIPPACPSELSNTVAASSTPYLPPNKAAIFRQSEFLTRRLCPIAYGVSRNHQHSSER